MTEDIAGSSDTTANGASANAMQDTVQVIRGDQASTYVVAEEHDDGSLLLTPDTADQAIAERTPRHQGSAVAGRGKLSEGQRHEPGIILEVSDLSVAYGPRKPSTI